MNISKKPSNIKRRKQPVPQQMLCTDIKIEEVLPEEAFIKAWNRLVDEVEYYLPEWQRVISGDDVLIAYRAKELMRLIEENGYIETISHFNEN